MWDAKTLHGSMLGEKPPLYLFSPSNLGILSIPLGVLP